MKCDLGRIKGAAFREYIAWYERTYGSAALRHAAAPLLLPGASDLDDGRPQLGVRTTRWYPAQTVHALLDGLVRDEDDQARRALAREVARAVLHATLRGAYRVLFDWMATPERYQAYGPKLWASFFDTGHCRIEGAEGRAHIAIDDWRSHHPFLCDINREAAIVIYREMGCRKVESTRHQCVGQGDPACRFSVRWS